MKKLYSILDELNVRGRVLIFGDDTDIHGQPNPDIVENLSIYCGILIDSEDYSQIDISKKLTKLGVSEFHSTEVVNPNRKSQWNKVSYEDRIDIFEYMNQLLIKFVKVFYFVYIPDSDYAKIINKAKQENKIDKIPKNKKKGLKIVFINSLIERLYKEKIPSAILFIDKDKNDKKELTFYNDSLNIDFLVGGSPIEANSSLICGLQLADLAAYLVSRFVGISKLRIEGDNANCFDEIITKTLATLFEMEKRYIMLL